MSKIKLLSEKTINQIAAGEVIDRPSSVVKELVENAVDAGATEIVVSIENGGKNLISIADNGCGISKEDLPIALQRHATSKLDEEDITNIRSLGFRGEALPSIASISNLTISSRLLGAEDAWQITASGGSMSQIHPASRSAGTHIEVKDLFMYTPVRLKFLKSDATEKNSILNWLQTFGLCYPHIAFSYFVDGRENFAYEKTSDLAKRARDVVGEKMFENLIHINHAAGGMSIRGFIGLPTFTQRSASNQFVFINGRVVKDKIVSQAVKVAYSNIMTHGYHPALILFIDIDPYELDVNVHPAKTEIRLMDQDKVRGFIISAIRRAIAANSPQTSTVVAEQVAKFAIAEQHVVNSSINLITEQPKPRALDLSEDYANKYYAAPKAHARNESVFSMPRSSVVHDVAQSNQPYLGFAKFQIDNTYIVAESAEGLVIVDQHAAHERMVLEQMKNSNAGLKRQALLIPIVIDIGELLTERVLEHKDKIAEFGIGIERNGITQILVREAPCWVAHDELQDMISEVIDLIANDDGPEFIDSKREAVLGNIACHSSIRAGRKLSIDEMNALLRSIESTPNASQCNHGRPTFVILKDSSLAKVFERI